MGCVAGERVLQSICQLCELIDSSRDYETDTPHIQETNSRLIQLSAGVVTSSTNLASTPGL